MSRVRDLLYRFRPAGAPGAASAAAVPMDRRSSLEAELSPLFAWLAVTERECDAVREEASNRASSVLVAAGDATRDILAATEGRIPDERAGEKERWRAKLAAEEADGLASASKQAARIRRDGAAQMAGRVRRIIDEIDRFVGAPPHGAGP